MEPREGVVRFLFLPLLDSNHPMGEEDLEEAAQIARSRSKSAAFDDARRYWLRQHGEAMGAQGFAKGTRWLATVRVEEGNDAFEALVAELQCNGSRRWTLASGEVVTDRYPSHLHEGVLERLAHVLGTIESRGRTVIEHCHDVGQPIGTTICVATRPGDEIIFAQRVNRNGLTRFVKNHQPEPCASLVVILRLLPSGVYEVRTSYIGQPATPEPWDTVPAAGREAECLQFWNTHALIWGLEPIIPGTETTECPW